MRRRNFRSWTRETSRLAHEAKRRKRLTQPAVPENYFPAGQLLHTIRIESHLFGFGFEVKVFQAARRNQIIAESFGRKSNPHGMDWLVRNLRKRLAVRWAATV